jgi:hypothetical protein
VPGFEVVPPPPLPPPPHPATVPSTIIKISTLSNDLQLRLRAGIPKSSKPARAMPPTLTQRLVVLRFSS